MVKIYNSFFQRLPVRRVASDNQLHLLNEAEIGRVRRIQMMTMLAAALLSVIGFLSYYLPIYWRPDLFPSAEMTLPFVGTPLRLPWGELFWGVLLTVVELYLLVLLNIAGVHEIAVATGFIDAGTKAEKGEALLHVGLGRKTREASRYGIDPFQGLNKWALFVFNTVLRLKGWLANQVVRYLTRLLLGRYAVRSVLDFAGMPIYMAINAYSVYAVLREARVIIMGQRVVGLVVRELRRRDLTAEEKGLLYDTLQFVAVSKRDFHQNHYLLTKNLLELFEVESEEQHALPGDYLERLNRAPDDVRALCQLAILLGFILDGQLSGRERRRLRALNRDGVLRESDADVKRYLRDFLDGTGAGAWSEDYLSRIAKGRAGDALKVKRHAAT